MLNILFWLSFLIGSLLQFFSNWLSLKKESFLAFVKHYGIRIFLASFVFFIITFFSTFNLETSLSVAASISALYPLFHSAAYSWYRTKDSIAHKYLVPYISEWTFIITFIIFLTNYIPRYYDLFDTNYTFIILALIITLSIYIYLNKKPLNNIVKFICYIIYSIINIIFIISIFYLLFTTEYTSPILDILFWILTGMQLVQLWSIIWQFTDIVFLSNIDNNNQKKQYKLIVSKITDYQINKKDIVFIWIYCILILLQNYYMNHEQNIIIYMIMLISIPIFNKVFTWKAVHIITQSISK